MKLRLKKKNAIIAASIFVVVLIEIINPFKIIATNKLQDLNYGKKSAEYIIKYGLKKDVLAGKYSEFIPVSVEESRLRILKTIVEKNNDEADFSNAKIVLAAGYGLNEGKDDKYYRRLELIAKAIDAKIASTRKVADFGFLLP